MRRLAFPLVHERTVLSSLWKPDESMNMIPHDDESQAQTILLGEFRAEVPDDNPSRSIRVQESSTPVARKRDEEEQAWLRIHVTELPCHHLS